MKCTLNVRVFGPRLPPATPAATRYAAGELPLGAVAVRDSLLARLDRAGLRNAKVFHGLLGCSKMDCTHLAPYCTHHKPRTQHW